MATPDWHFPAVQPLARTGFTASRLGIGDVADRAVPFEQCVATVRRAMDAGLNVIDTAPGYEDGYSERIVGEAVRGRREQVFVITKVDHPDRPVAPQVHESLERLALGRVDCLLFHGVSTLKAWEALLAPDGPMDQLDVCRKAGATRFTGISSHHPDVLRAAVLSSRCDLLMFPVSAAGDLRYVTDVLPMARQHGVATIGFKVFGAGKLLTDTEGYGRPLAARPRGKVSSGGAGGQPRLPCLPVDACVRYALTCNPDVALLGLSFPCEQDAAFKAAASFTPMPEAEMAETRELAAKALAAKGAQWWNPSPL